MKISEAIKKLQDELNSNGDLDIVTYTESGTKIYPNLFIYPQEDSYEVYLE